MPAKKAVIYARVSPKPTKAEDKCESIDRQIELCHRYCDTNDIIVVDIATDPKVSGRLQYFYDRPGGRKVRDLLPLIDYVISSEHSRMFRNTIDGLQTLDDWLKYDVSARFIGEGTCFATNTPFGRLATTMFLAIAEVEAGNNSHRTKVAAELRKEQGKLVCSEINVPWGKKVVGEKLDDGTDTRRLVDDPREQIVLGCIIGHHKAGLKPTAIAAMLNERGEGYARRDESQPWDRNHIHHILSEHGYKKKRGKKKRRKYG